MLTVPRAHSPVCVAGERAPGSAARRWRVAPGTGEARLHLVLHEKIHRVVDVPVVRLHGVRRRRQIGRQKGSPRVVPSPLAPLCPTGANRRGATSPGDAVAAVHPPTCARARRAGRGRVGFEGRGWGLHDVRARRRNAENVRVRPRTVSQFAPLRSTTGASPTHSCPMFVRGRGCERCAERRR